MKGIIVLCPNKQCRKMMFKNAYIRPGSFLTTKCFYCGMLISVTAEPGKIALELVDFPVEQIDLQEDDDVDIINLNL